MVFKKLLGAFGVGGPSVDTVLEDGAVRPGGTLAGEVRLVGGTADREIARVGLELVAHVEAEGGDGERTGSVAFERFTVGGGFRLAAEAEHTVPFSVTLPWETPLTELYGQRLGVVLGVRTTLEIAGAKDKGDLDPLRVEPLAAQGAVLEALGQLGCGFVSADLELGHIHGTDQRAPFYQELELTPPARFADSLREIEVTFLAHPTGMDVVLEADRRGGFLGAGGDVLNRFAVRHDEVAGTDWIALLTGQLEQLADRTQPSYGGGDFAHKGEYGHEHERHGRSGPGVGTAIAAGAAGVAVGVAGGLVAAEVVDEIGDAFEDDDEGDGGGDDEG